MNGHPGHLARVAAPLLAGCLLAGTGEPSRAASQDPANPRPSYPPKALAYGIDAEVVLLMRAGEAGEVRQVKLEEVSAPGWGFARAAKEAAGAWRFEPARVDGKAVPRVYRRTLKFEADHDHDLARMYPVSSDRAFSAVRELFEDLGLSTHTVLEDEQVIMTADLPLSGMPEGFPSVQDLGSARWRFVQLHLFVPAGTEPARVYCNARLARLAGDYVSAALYSEGTVEAWLLDRLDARLEARGRAVPLNPDRRNQLASQLAAEAGTEPTQAIPRILTPGDPEYERVEPAIPITETRVPAVDPTDPRPRPARSTVKLEAVIHADGSVAIASVLSSPERESEQLRSAAAQAARLWRFQPATFDGRPASMATTLAVTFPERSH
jgi:TonB family protein